LAGLGEVVFFGGSISLDVLEDMEVRSKFRLKKWNDVSFYSSFFCNRRGWGAPLPDTTDEKEKAPGDRHLTQFSTGRMLRQYTLHVKGIYREV
jgi:hypothetical protein